jgi:hypothetical protein
MYIWFQDLVSTNFTGYGGAIAPGYPYFSLINVVNIGTSLPDIVMLIGGINLDVCKYISEESQVAPDATWDFSGETARVLTGNVPGFIDDPTVRTLGDDLPAEQDYIGKTSFCLNNAAGNYGTYYIVILER